MKKLFLVLVLVAVYGISISNVSAKVITVEKSNITVVADTDDNVTNPVLEEEKDKKKSKKKETKSACCGEAQKKSCEASKKSCGDTKKKEEKK